MPTPGELITQNGTTVGGYDSAGNAAYFGGPPAATAVAPVAAPTTTVSTSDPARSNYSAIEQAIAKLSGNPPAVPGAPTNAPLSSNQALLEDRRSQLQKRRDAEVERLGKEFDSAKASQGQAQKSETGTSSMGLARIGGFDSASGQAVLTNLQRVHEGEQQDLLNKRQAAIAQAQNAYEDKDFELAQLQLEDAREAEKLIYDRQKDFINLSLQLKGEQRADLNSQLQQAQFEYGKQKDQRAEARSALEFAVTYGIGDPFYVVGGIGYDTSTGEKLSYEDFIARGGKPDFSNATIITPGSLEDKAFVQSLRNTYVDAGITSQDTAEEAQAKIKNSRIYRKETYIAPSGGITAGQTKNQADVIQRARAALQAEASGSQDGKANPDTYRNFMSEYIQANGNANDFYLGVSLDQYIDPKNRVGDLAGTSIQYQQQKAGSLSPADKEARLQDLLTRLEANPDSLSLAELQELQTLRK